MTDETVLILLRFAEEGAEVVDNASAKLEGLGAQAKLTNAEQVESAAGAQGASRDMADGIEDDAGSVAGSYEGMKAASHDASEGIGNDLADVAGNMGGMSGASHDLEKDVAKDTEKMGEHGGILSSVFSKLGNSMGNFGLPFSESFSKAGEAMEGASGSAEGLLGAMGALAPVAAAGAAAMVIGIGAESIHLADDFDEATAKLAAGAGITVKQANAIGKAFLGTAGNTTYSAQALMTAYAPVAAQLGTISGHALTARQSMKFMSAAMDLAEGTGSDLTKTTGDLSSVMQAFDINASQAAGVSDILFSTSQKTGNTVDALTTSFTKMHAQLGVLTPSVGQLGGLLTDMAAHGETGRQGMSAVQVGLQSLLKPAEDVQVDTQAQATAFSSLTPKLKALANAYREGKLSTTQLTDATDKLPASQSVLLSQWTDAYSKVSAATLAYKNMHLTVVNAKGDFVGMSSIISQLHDQLHGETQAQQLATLQTVFGASANRKLLAIVDAGPAAYAKYTKQVQATNTAHAAATKVAGTFHGQMEILGSTLEDTGVRIGQALIPWLQKLVPVVEEVIKWIADATVFMLKHKTVLEGVVIAVTALIAPYLLVIAGLVIFLHHWKAIWAEVKAIALDVWHRIDAVWQGIEGDTRKTWDSIVDAFKAAWARIKAALTDAWKFIDGTWQTMVKVAKDVFAMIVAILEGHWGKAFSDAKAIWTTIIHWFDGVPSQILRAFGGLAEGFLKLGLKITQYFLKGLANLGSDALKLLEKVPVVGGLIKTGHSVLHALGLAEGAVVRSPQLAVVGEKGPEVILPINDMNRAQQLLQQAGMLSALQSAGGAGVGSSGGGIAIHLGGGTGPAKNAQWDQLQAHLQDLWDALMAEAKLLQTMIDEQRNTTRSVAASASKIAGGIVTTADELNADFAQLISRRVR